MLPYISVNLVNCRNFFCFQLVFWLGKPKDAARSTDNLVHLKDGRIVFVTEEDDGQFLGKEVEYAPFVYTSSNEGMELVLDFSHVKTFKYVRTSARDATFVYEDIWGKALHCEGYIVVSPIQLILERE